MSNNVISDNSAFDLNILNNIRDDKSIQTLETIQSLEPGAYKLQNFYPKDCGQTNARNIQTSQVGINFSGGDGSIGKDGCLVDTNSYVRYHELTNLNTINQLNTRLTLTTPFIRGYYNVDNESYLISGDGTKQHRTCNVLSGVSLLDYYYVPQVEKLKKNVQNSIHIIPEDNMSTWKQGGLSTRQIMRNMDYYNRCENEKNCKK
tara:strand:- start:4281 stop:4892 length:612 start_codon:yes stop_codon:yes gene_type:complete